MSYETQRGMYLHSTYAISLAREPLGVMDAWMWARQPKAADGKRHDIKESQRWIEGYEQVAERARELPETRQVYVADREADIHGFAGACQRSRPCCRLPDPLPA